jgi:tetratricopeptide (TPR) repeat protein
MRNMGKTFKYLDDNIFPKLRRAEISIVYDLTGYTDEELKTISTTMPDSLKVEELLFAATLTNDLNTKLQIYTAAQKKYPEDARTHNNVGAVLYMQNKVADAKSHFEKANSLNDNAISKNNLGACAGASGDRAKAKQLFTAAKGAGNEVGYNSGILHIMAGKYPEAVSSFGSDASFNKALAEILNNSVDNAVKTLDKSSDKESAQGFYLKAVASARQNNVDATVSNLKNAFQKKSQEFEKYIKVGRTHLQDATPIKLSQEFSAFVMQISNNLDRLDCVMPRLLQLAQGGTAVGTGINCPEGFPEAFAKAVARHTKLPFISAPN